MVMVRQFKVRKNSDMLFLTVFYIFVLYLWGVYTEVYWNGMVETQVFYSRSIKRILQQNHKQHKYLTAEVYTEFYNRIITNQVFTTEVEKEVLRSPFV